MRRCTVWWITWFYTPWNYARSWDQVAVIHSGQAGLQGGQGGGRWCEGPVGWQRLRWLMRLVLVRIMNMVRALMYMMRLEIHKMKYNPITKMAFTDISQTKQTNLKFWRGLNYRTGKLVTVQKFCFKNCLNLLREKSILVVEKKKIFEAEEFEIWNNQ